MQRRRPDPRRGFTLLELCFVIAILAALSAVTVPSLQVVYRRAQAAEAEAMLHAIAHSELQHRRDHGRFLACSSGTGIPNRPTAFEDPDGCWRALGVEVGGDVRYRYRVTLADGSFEATAEGDLDRDGQPSRYVLDGRTLQLTKTDPLE